MRKLHSLRLAMIASALFTITISSASSAAEVAPTWVRDFNATVNWQRVTSHGDLIVSTANGLHGMEPTTGVITWSHTDLARLPAGGFREIAGAPLFMIDDGESDRRIMILNAINGAVVFDSRKAGLVEVQGKYVMPRSGGLLIVGFKQGNFNTQLAMYDMASGAQRWHSEVLSEGQGKMTNLLMAIAQVSFDIQAVHADPMELEDGSILFGAMGAVHRLNAATGESIWKTEAGNARVLHLAEQRPGVVFVGSEEGDDSSPYYATYQALALDSGAPVWDKPVRVRGALNPLFIETDAGLIISERTKGKGRIRMLDLDSGTSLWGKKGKGIKVKGGIVDYDFSDAGLVVTTGYDSAWNDKGTEYLLYVLNTAQGALRFKDPLVVRGRMLQTELLEHGLLYVTTHEVNVFSTETGKLINESLVRSKSPITTRWHGDHLYAFNTQEGLLYRIDRRNSELQRQSAAKTKLDGKDTPLEIEVRGDDVVLTGHQNVVGFGPDGNVQFSAYHPAPRHHGVVQALLWAQAIRAAMASVDTGSAAVALAAASGETEQGTLAHEFTTELGQGFAEASEDLAGIAGDYAKEARRRFQASATSRDFVFMMVKLDKRNALAQVSKNNGQIVALIDMGKDKEPSYQVDDVGDRIFYRASDTAITAYDFAGTSVASSGL